MKKLFLMFFLAALTGTVSAQALMESKAGDNHYIGINGGVATKTTGHSWMGDLNWNVGLRLGRWLTPTFGLAVESNVYFSNKPGQSIGTGVRSMNTSGLVTLNFDNLFAGYAGEPRLFEVIGLFGLGWGHVFGHSIDKYDKDTFNSIPGENRHRNTRSNTITSKAAIDFAFNLGAQKEWQIYLEPAMIWDLGSHSKTEALGEGWGTDYVDGNEYDLGYSGFQLNVGVIYKFKNSNGTHNFKIAQIRDQAEIDALNAKINELRNIINDKDAELAAKDKQIADLQAALDECNSKPKAEGANLQPTVLFRQGKSVIDAAQYAPVELIAQYMKNHPEAQVEIKGYASPEGNPEFNQKLSEDRAEAVKKALVSKYKIDADRLTTKGCGPTDKLFEQVEFNRVVTFNDNTK